VADKSPSTGPVFATGRPYRETGGNRGRKDRPLSWAWGDPRGHSR